MKVYPGEIVEWVDSSSSDGWDEKHSIEEDFDEDLTCYSVGFVVYESDDRIVLLSHDGSKLWSTRITIPKVCVVKRQPLVPDPPTSSP